MDNLSDNIPFGYTLSQKISVSQISPSQVVLSSPAIQDELGNKIKKYTVMYSEYPLAQILQTPTLLDQSKEKTFDFSVVNWDLSMALTVTWDALDPAKVYYLSIIPKDQNNILGEISNEIRIKLSDSTSWEGVYTDASHGSAGADMSLANVSHTINGNKVTLTWISLAGSDKVDILLWDPTANVFNKLSTVSMSAEKYEFTLTRNGEFIVNFMPNNWGKEKRYTFVVTGVTPATTTTPVTTKPTITKVPHVWPVENVAVALFISFFLYLLYKRNHMRVK